MRIDLRAINDRGKYAPHRTEQPQEFAILGEFILRFPQYTLQEARRLPAKHIVTLLTIARRLEAQRNLTQLLITTAPHSKKGKMVRDLEKAFKRQANG